MALRQRPGKDRHLALGRSFESSLGGSTVIGMAGYAILVEDEQQVRIGDDVLDTPASSSSGTSAGARRGRAKAARRSRHRARRQQLRSSSARTSPRDRAVSPSVEASPWVKQRTRILVPRSLEGGDRGVGQGVHCVGADQVVDVVRVGKQRVLRRRRRPQRPLDVRTAVDKAVPPLTGKRFAKEPVGEPGLVRLLPCSARGGPRRCRERPAGGPGWCRNDRFSLERPSRCSCVKRLGAR